MKKILLLSLFLFVGISVAFAQKKSTKTQKYASMEAFSKEIESNYTAITNTETAVSGATFKMNGGQALFSQDTEASAKTEIQKIENEIAPMFNGTTWKFEPCQNHGETNLKCTMADGKLAPTTYFPMGGILGVKIFDDIQNTGVYVFQHNQNKNQYIFMFPLPLTTVMYAINCVKS